MRKGLCAFAALMLLSQPGHACHPPNRLTGQDIGRADSVFLGKIVALSADGVNAVPSLPRITTMMFEIVEMKRGRPIDGRIEVYGAANSLSGDLPASVQTFQAEYGTLVEVGIVFPETIQERTTCRLANVSIGSKDAEVRTYCQVDLPVALNYPRPREDAQTDLLDRPWIVGEACTERYIFGHRTRPLR